MKNVVSFPRMNWVNFSKCSLVLILIMWLSIRLLGVVLLCTYIALVSAIVGGHSAVKGQFPYEVSFRNRRNNLHFCGGAIISRIFILSAGHCTFKLIAKVESIYGVVDITHANDTGISIEFISNIIHPEFDPKTRQPDLALLRTKEPMTFTDSVKPINLPNQEFIAQGTPAFIAGWGMSVVGLYKMLSKSVMFIGFRSKIGNDYRYLRLRRIRKKCYLAKHGQKPYNLKQHQHSQWRNVSMNSNQ